MYQDDSANKRNELKNIEIKARYPKTNRIHEILKTIEAEFSRTEIQTETYYNVESGRLKIREIESGPSQLVHYFRENKAGPRPSRYEIVRLREVKKVKARLLEEHGLHGVVKKKREIWIWENVRIHLDEVDGLGRFLELEAVVDKEEDIKNDEGKVLWLMEKFGIKEKDLVAESYIDMV
jgi:predicted adenylyl cyclase CyaB